MKRLFYILALFTGIANAQIVNIPDPIFKARLIQFGVDTSGDGEIQQSEAQAMSTLNVTNTTMTNATGIEAFTNLLVLNIENNQLASLDVSALTVLETLSCNDNLLTSLNVNGLQQLSSLTCYNNRLSTLDVTSVSNLGGLDCKNNLLASLSCSNLSQLSSIDCSQNLLTELDLSGDPSLVFITCGSNSLTTLDVSGLGNLLGLKCDNNDLTELNFFNCPVLDNIDCSNNALTTLDLTGLNTIQGFRCHHNQLTGFTVTNPVAIDDFYCSNNQFVDFDCSKIRLLGTLECQNNPLNSINLKNGYSENFVGYFVFTPTIGSIRFICEDDNQLTALNSYMTTFGITTAVANSYCSFTPGGNYNTISGRVTFDANNNGCDVNDDIQPNVRVNISDGSTTGAGFTNSAGNYAFYAQTGSFTLTPNIENPSWFNFSPASTTIPFANSNNNVVTRDFCLSANGVHSDVEVVIAPLGNASPGFEPVYKLVIKNKGNQTLEGTIIFNYNDSVLDFMAADAIPSVNSSGILTFNYANLQPFESRSIRVFMHLNAPTDTPPVNIGDQLNFSATVSPTAGDENPADNQFQYHQTVVGSFDPNDITCIEGNIVPPSEIGNYLHYIINFENTGTAAAQNIVVRDVIDVNQFDVNSLQVLDSSAGVTTKLTGNVAEFIFQNINLHSGGHGNILLKVKSRNTLTEGSSVSKRANIYFDYNFPVATNPENTTFQTLSNPDIPMDATISVYPNPTKGNINISSNNTIKSVQLYDVQGRVLQTNLVNENQATLDISGQSSGIYFVKIISDRGMAVHKIVKE